MSTSTTKSKPGKGSTSDQRIPVFGAPTVDQIEDEASPFYVPADQRDDFWWPTTKDGRSTWSKLMERRNTREWMVEAVKEAAGHVDTIGAPVGRYVSTGFGTTSSTVEPFDPDAWCDQHSVTVEGVWAWARLAEHARDCTQHRAWLDAEEQRQARLTTCEICGQPDDTTRTRTASSHPGAYTMLLPARIANAHACDSCAWALILEVAAPSRDHARRWLTTPTG